MDKDFIILHLASYTITNKNNQIPSSSLNIKLLKGSTTFCKDFSRSRSKSKSSNLIRTAKTDSLTGEIILYNVPKDYYYL